MSHQVAQINIGRLLAPPDDPRIAEFVNALDAINALADGSPGFVWRLQTDAGNAIDVRPDAVDDLMAVNMSVWTDIDSLVAYVYRSEHRRFLQRRLEWFERPTGHHAALWWIPAGTIPTVDEGMKRVALLNEQGPTEQAFTFAKRFPAPEPSA